MNKFLLTSLLVFLLIGSMPLSSSAYYPASVKTVAGSGEFGNENGKGDQVSFRFPTYGALAPNGTVLLADTQSHLIRIYKDGVVSTLAGKTDDIDQYGMPLGGFKDGKSSEAMFDHPKGIAIAKDGTIYIADFNNNAIRMIKDGNVTTLVKNLNGPSDIVIGNQSELFISDTMNHRIVKVSTNGAVETISGGNYKQDGEWLIGDYQDGKGLQAKFNEPTGLAIDSAGNIYVADTGNQRIRKILPTYEVTTLAGSGKEVVSGTSYIAGGMKDGSAQSALFNYPNGIDIDSNGNLFVADTFNHRIRIIMPEGYVHTVSGNGESGIKNGTEESARFDGPTDVIVQTMDDLMIIDNMNNKVRELTWFKMPNEVKSDSINVIFNDELIQFEGVNPKIVNGRTMIPIRKISETFGYEVKYDQNTKEINLSDNKKALSLILGSKQVKGSIEMNLDVVPYAEEGRTMIPLRFVVEAFDYKVDWLPEKKVVLIR